MRFGPKASRGKLKSDRGESGRLVGRVAGPSTSTPHRRHGRGGSATSMATLSQQRAAIPGQATRRRARWLAPALMLGLDLAALLAAAGLAGRTPLAFVYSGLALIVLATSRAY